MDQQSEETNPDLKALAAAYGECLWDWASIEAQLFLVFMAASGLVRCATFADTEHRKMLARTFFAIIGMKIRVEVTHALAQQRWEKSPHLATWKAIYKRLDKQRRVRGTIGHRTAFMFSDHDRSKPPIALLIDPRLYVDIAVSYQDVKTNGISLSKLLQIHQDFLSLQKLMTEFVGTLLKEQLAAFPQPQADPPLPLREGTDDQTPKGSP